MPSSNRVYYIDTLRVFLTALVVLHHTAIACGAPGGWYYRIPLISDTLSDILLSFFVGINQAFFMSLFFMLAAYFIPGSYDKKGPLSFFSDRLKRLGIPLLAFVFLLQPMLVYMVRAFNGTLAEKNLFLFLRHTTGRVGPGPLWFVFALLLFSCVYLLYRMSPFSFKVPSALRRFPSNRFLLCFILAAGLIAFLVRLFFPTGWAIFGQQLGYFPLYIGMFVAGILSARFQWLEAIPQQSVRLWFRAALVAILAMPFIMILSGALEGDIAVFNGGLHWEALAYALWEPFLCVGISLKLVTLFQQRFNVSTALSQEFSANAYTVYIMHPFIVISASYCFAGLAWPGWLCFLLLSPIVLFYTFLLAAPIRRLPALRRIL